MQKIESLSVEWRNIEDVRPYAGNPRVITKLAIEKVAESIRTFGWRQPIVVDEAGEILVGHTRHLAAKRLNLQRIPVHVAEGLSVSAAKAYRLADNRTHDEAQWDSGALALELNAISVSGFELGLTAFDLSELPHEPIFEPSSEPTSPRLDRLTEFKCPNCGHDFQAGARR